ncbi:MAG: hypothetical protein H6917_18425 [Novosphingobium sp.]|nr:hypothetical protein [Novosphingobium sp.]MCP5404354.1 hypothetical protein [Novosphingobium sp.]
MVPITAGRSTVETKSFVENLVGEEKGPERKRDDDLALYDRAIERIQKGENYYDFIVEEHRQANYPVRPGLAVRLPTLAYIDAWLGEPGQIVMAMVLMIAVLLAWWRRLGDEPGGPRHRLIAMSLLFVGVSLGLNRYYFVLHELWAGMLLVLSFGLHRPGKWGASLAVAALAVAIREHALPFVLLMGAMAFWRRDWKEGAAWTALTVAFLVALAVHLSIVSELVLPSERPSDPWLVMRGLSGWLSNIALSSNLRFLPHWLAGPAVILMVLGWCGWRSPAGTFGTFLFLGYGLAFMLAGRPDNFYWGAVIAPAMFMGLAFVPRFSRSLVNAALAK